jgi:peptide chain release factor 1
VFEQLREVSARLDEIVRTLAQEETARDPVLLQSLMKEQARLMPVNEAYTDYLSAQETIAECEEMLSSEHDEDMRGLLKEELQEAKEREEKAASHQTKAQRSTSRQSLSKSLNASH